MERINEEQFIRTKEVPPPNNLPVRGNNFAPESMLPAITDHEHSNLPAIKEKEELVIIEKKLPAKIKRKKNAEIQVENGKSTQNDEREKIKKEDVAPPKSPLVEHANNKDRIFISDEDKKKVPPIIISNEDLSFPQKSKIRTIQPSDHEKKLKTNRIIPIEHPDETKINLKHHNQPLKNNHEEKLIDPDDIQSNFIDRLKQLGIN